MKFAIFLQHYFPYGGLQRDAVRLAEAALTSGDHPTIIVSTWNGEKPEAISVIELHSGGSSNHAKASNFAKACQPLIQSDEYDTSICFSRVPRTPFHFCGDPCFQEKFQHNKPALAKYLPRYRYMLKSEEALFGADSNTHIFFLAASEISAYQKYYPLPENKFTLLPPWLKVPEHITVLPNEIRKEITKELNIAAESQLLLFVGSDFKRKGLDLALQAIASLKTNDLHLAVCGKYNPTDYQNLATHLGIGKQIHFLGPRDDIPRLMIAADVLLHPARQETAGMVLLEALSYGLPVICSEQCGYSEHVAAAGGSLLKKNHLTTDFANLLETTLHQQSSLSNMALKWASAPALYQTSGLILDTMRDSLTPA